jgi:copper chaperone CopZ
MKAVEDGLRRLEGVETVKIALQTNLVTITLDPKTEIDLRTIPSAIRESGFVPGEMVLVARGRLERANGQMHFRILGWGRPLPVTSTEAVGERELRIRAQVDHSASLPRLIVPEGDR